MVIKKAETQTGSNSESATEPLAKDDPAKNAQQIAKGLKDEAKSNKGVDQPAAGQTKPKPEASNKPTHGYASFRSTTDHRLQFLQMDETMEAAIKTIDNQEDDGSTEEFLFIVPVSYFVDRLG